MEDVFIMAHGLRRQESIVEEKTPWAEVHICAGTDSEAGWLHVRGPGVGIGTGTRTDYNLQGWPPVAHFLS